MSSRYYPDRPPRRPQLHTALEQNAADGGFLALVAAAIAVTFVQLFRLRKVRLHTPHVSRR